MAPFFAWLLFVAKEMRLAIGGGLVGFLLATLLAVSRYAEVPVLGRISAAYVEFIRNTPPIVQLFFVVFGLPLLLG